MMKIRLLKRNKFISGLFLYIYHKLKNRHLVKFFYSSHLSHRCEFEGMNMVGSKSSFYGRMGLGTYIGADSHLNADIGRFTSIAGGFSCVNATHPMKAPFVTTCPLFFSLDTNKNPQQITFARKQMVEEFRYYAKQREIDVNIGNDCWIGANVTFIGGINVGDGAVVLANAWVTKDVPPYAIVGGTPAKIMDYRYDKATIEFLIEIKWWNNSIEWFQENWELLCDIEKMKSDYGAK